MKYFEEIIDNAICKYPSLSATKTERGVSLRGILVLNAEYNDIPLYDEYEIEIDVPKEFPKLLPTVKEISNLIPTDFNHFLTDGSFCLAAQCELIDFAVTDKTLTGYIDKYVMNYLYTASYFSRYGEFPFGERSHGVDGIKEAYSERYNCNQEAALIGLLCLLSGIKRYRGHDICTCGSGKRLRDCHGQLVLRDIQSDFYPYYRCDAYEIISAYIERRKGMVDKNGESGTSKK
ncbi:MAG: hypothetical protein Q4B26_06625 [Eubacteriales bacterium]|nr:hypothetical protein [Eubacteriales bacterium]